MALFATLPNFCRICYILKMAELVAKERRELGKKSRALRRAGFLPAVVYGEGVGPESISVSARDFEKAYAEAGESSLVALSLDGKKLNVMIHDVAYDPLTLKPIHADFYSVRMDKEVETKVEIEFMGEPPAVKNEGGILVKVMHELEVKALPRDLPHTIAVDLSGLGTVGGRIFVKDVRVADGVRVLDPEDGVVVLIEAPRAEEVLAAPADAGEVAEVKTEAEEKREAKAAKDAAEKSVETESR